MPANKVISSPRQHGKSKMQAYMRMFNDIYSQPLEKLICTEGKVYGARYHCVEPIGGRWLEMEAWAIQTYGDPGVHMWGDGIVDPGQRWYMNNRKFWFRQEKDRTMFILRWS
jgi:hypothetical protein